MHQPGTGMKSLAHFLLLLLCGAAIGFAVLNWQNSEAIRKVAAPTERNG
jgi:hypothetical protein